MGEVTKNYIGVATWGDTMIQFPVDGDRHYLKYRRDIFEDPKMQARYKKDKGKELRVPTTWEEYNEVASLL